MGGRGSGRRSTRSWLYWIAKILGDFTAIGKGHTGRRVGRRITGRWLSKIFRIIILGTLLVPIYEPGQVLVPKYYIRKSPDGSVRVYDSRQILVPKYIIRDNRLYEPGKPLTPSSTIKPREGRQE